MLVNQSLVVDDNSLYVDILDNTIILLVEKSVTPPVVFSTVSLLEPYFNELEQKESPWGLIFCPGQDFSYFTESYYYIERLLRDSKYHHFSYVNLVADSTRSIEGLLTLCALIRLSKKELAVHMFMSLCDALNWVLLNNEKT